MSDKFNNGIVAGSTSLDIPVLLRVKSDGAELTGKVATAVVAYYWRQSAASAIEITCATLGSLGAAYSAGGWYEVGSVMPGAYRLCLPNTALSTGADWVTVGVRDTAGSGFAFYERYALNAAPNNLAYADVLSAASAAWAAATTTNRVRPADGSITNAVFGTSVLTAAVFAADCITSAKVAAGAFTYDDQITTFKSELSGLVIAIPNGHITSAKIGADAIGSDKVGAGAFVYGDQITVFDASIQSAASSAWAAAALTNRVTPAVGSITNAVFGTDVLTAAVFAADFLTSAKVAAGALTYNDQITSFQSELSGIAITIPNGHITSAKIGADAIGSDKVAAGAFVYGDQITSFDADVKSAASAAWAAAASTSRVIPAVGSITNAVFGTDVLTAAVFAADCITSAKVAAGAMVYGDQITAFDADVKSAASAALAAWGKDEFRLSVTGVRDVTQYTSAQGGVPGSSPSLYDAVVWNAAQSSFKRTQTPTTYLLHLANGTAFASAPVSGDSASVTIGVFTNV